MSFDLHAIMCMRLAMFQIGKILYECGYECGYVSFAFFVIMVVFCKKKKKKKKPSACWLHWNPKVVLWQWQIRVGDEHNPIRFVLNIIFVLLHHVCSLLQFNAMQFSAIWVWCFTGFRPCLTVNVKVTVVDLMVRPTSYGQAKSLVTVGLWYIRVHWGVGELF